jgi:hypothetical protein
MSVKLYVGSVTCNYQFARGDQIDIIVYSNLSWDTDDNTLRAVSTNFSGERQCFSATLVLTTSVNTHRFSEIMGLF